MGGNLLDLVCPIQLLRQYTTAKPIFAGLLIIRDCRIQPKTAMGLSRENDRRTCQQSFANGAMELGICKLAHD